MDLSKAFVCLWIFYKCCYFFYSYLKRRNQNVRINNTHSVFQLLLSEVPQDSMLGPILFNVFINDLYLWITKTDLLNFTDDNTISAAERTIETFLQHLKQKVKPLLNGSN